MKTRNLEIHGETKSESRVKRLERLQETAHVLYKRAKLLEVRQDDDVKEVFKLSKEKRKYKGVFALETWTKLAEKVVNVGEKRLKAHKENGLVK